MPPSKTSTPRRRAYLNTDDLLVRLICLPEREQETVLAELAAAIETAEEHVITRQAMIFDARHAPSSAMAQ
jgi:hypothetical protein